MTEAEPGAIAVVADTAEETAATGGAPIVEQALAALRTGLAVRPIPALPDRAEDMSGFSGIILDDPPGLTPEQRRALAQFVDSGGVVLLALGPRAASAPLGASFEPLLAHATGWSPSPSPGANPESAASVMSESAATLADLAPRGRATLAPEDVSAIEPLVAWKDGAPLVARRAMGRGEAWIATLPFAVEASDLTLRPGFLALLDAWVGGALVRAAPRRGDVGTPWTFTGRDVAIEGPAGPVAVTRDAPPAAVARAVPALVGAYRIAIDGRKELRVAAPPQAELDLRPRATQENARGSALGDNHAAVDVSWAVALALLGLLALEMALRIYAKARPAAT
jgi:hypothetical protein